MTEDQEEYDEVYDDNDGHWGQEGGIERDRVQPAYSPLLIAVVIRCIDSQRDSYDDQRYTPSHR